jgi:hypothetical protein
MRKLLNNPGYAAYDVHNNLILTYGRDMVDSFITEYTTEDIGGKYA